MRSLILLVLFAVLLICQAAPQAGVGRVVIFRAKTQPITPIKSTIKRAPKHTHNGIPKSVPVISKTTGKIVKPALKRFYGPFAKSVTVADKKKSTKKTSSKKTAKKSNKKTSKKKPAKKNNKKKTSKKSCKISANEHKKKISTIKKLLPKQTRQKCLDISKVKRAVKTAKRHHKKAKSARKQAAKKFAKFADKFSAKVTSHFAKLAGCKKPVAKKPAKKVQPKKKKACQDQSSLEFLEQLRLKHATVRQKIEAWAKAAAKMDKKSRQKAINDMKKRLAPQFHKYLLLANGDKATEKRVAKEEKLNKKVTAIVAADKKNRTGATVPSGPLPFSGFQIKVHID